MIFTKLQQQFLHHHWAKWSADYGWNARRFAEVTKQPAEALAELLGIPIADFAPPPQSPNLAAEAAQSTPVETPPTPAELPSPGNEAIIIEPGQEFIPKERPIPAPPPQPQIHLRVGKHTIDNVEVFITSDSGQDYVWVPITAGWHVVDGCGLMVQPVHVARGFSV